MTLGFRPACKIWFEKDGEVFGEGLYNLLLLIESMGSISGAAGHMEMSYRTAWGKIRAAEKRWGIRLVNARVGGETGGCSRLTVEAAQLVNRFRRFREEADRLLNNWSTGL
ncbi:MAG: winged helix-turn-helix domain-containing protein [Bacillota bacterium]